ncbi:DUF4350 domain-containing protein [Palaeococcus sp. (in: euryarchaeotes)]
MNRVAYGILLIVGIALLIMPMSVPVFKSNAEYSVLNTEWDGVSSFGKLLYSSGEITPLLAPYDSVGLGSLEGTLIVIGPNVDFSTGEIEQLRMFLDKGNILILADDFGTGNQILTGLGVKERFSKSPILSVIYSKNYNFPITVDIRKKELSKGVERIILSKPAAILNAREGIVYTSNASMLGREYGAFPVMVELEYGKGRIILISDPDVFTNSLFKENGVFLQNLISYIPKKTFYIDEAHHRDFNPYSSGSVVIRRSVNKELVFYYVLFVAFVAFIIESGIAMGILERVISLVFKFLGEEKESVDEIIERLEREGFDGDTLKRIVEEIKTGSKIGGGHGR